MIDIKLLREDPELVRENIRKKFQDRKLPLVDEAIALDKRNREIKQEVEALRARRNQVSKQIGALMGQGKKDEAMAVKAEVATFGDRINELTKEENETAEQAIVREIREELEVEIEVRRHVVDVAWDYPDFHLEMACFLCHIKEGAPRLVEHEAAVWLDPQDIDSVDWLDADVLVVNALKDQGIV